MPTEAFINKTDALRALGGQRVWSLMISLFGDLAQKDGDRIDGPVLSAIMAALQVKPEAARVALHRLRNDGWITSTKAGRISQHSLTEKGRAESAAASPRIYADIPDPETPWQIVITSTPENLTAAGFAQLMPRVFVGPPAAVAPTDALCFTAKDAPEWLRTQVAPDHLRQEYKALLDTLDQLDRDLPDAKALSTLEVAVLRCLIVHNWRRLVLKHPELPSALMPKDWPGLQCHARFAALLDRFPRPALRDITLQTAAA